MQVTHLAVTGSVSTGQTLPQGHRSQGESPGHGTPLIPKLWDAEPWLWTAGPGRVVPLAGGGWGAQPLEGYLDTVLQAVAHGRADLLVVTEQSG